jgi:hypothetical protein
MTGLCKLCCRLTKHHVIPKARHNKKVKRETTAEERNRIEWICRPCHSQIHRLFTEKQLEREFKTIELLLTNPDVKTWVAWIRKRPHLGKELKP